MSQALERSRERAGIKVGARPSWLADKKPIILFIVLFGVLLGLFYACTFIPFMSKNVLPRLQELNAKASVVLLNWFDEGASANETLISSPRFNVNIAHGCDAIEPAGLFVAAVLAFPAPLLSKLPGIMIGLTLLLSLNLVRIVTLFYSGVYFSHKTFEMMHVDVWQPAFIVLSLFFWIVWAWWATKPKPVSMATAG